jgi:hypothetical protein
MNSAADEIFSDHHGEFESVAARYSPLLFGVALRRFETSRTQKTLFRTRCYLPTSTLTSSRAARNLPRGSRESSSTPQA